MMRKIIVISLLSLLFVSFSFAGTYSGGTGKPNDPYKIANVADFQQLSTTPTDCNKSFILIADINLTGLAFTQAPIAPDTNHTLWNGFQGTKFTGIFDGNDNAIYNFTYTAANTDFAGLFGFVGSGGKIKNLTLIDVNVTGNAYTGGLAGYNVGAILNCSSTGRITGYDKAGGLVGSNYGIITCCNAVATVRAGWDGGGLVGDNFEGTISHCSARADVYSSVRNSGGLVGVNYGTVRDCNTTGIADGAIWIGGLAGYNYDGTIINSWTAANVYGGYYAGNLVGFNHGRIQNSYAVGSTVGTGYCDHIGGLAGGNDYTISNCYATGDVNGYGMVGGLVGRNDGSYASIAKCYSTGHVSGHSQTGGLVGYNSGGVATNSFWNTETSGLPNSDGGTGKTTAEMKTLLIFTSAGWDFTNETINGTNDYWRMCTNGVVYPHFNWESMAGDFACPNGVSIEDLRAFAGKWLLNYCASSNNYCGGTDMNYSGNVNFLDFAIFANNWLLGE